MPDAAGGEVDAAPTGDGGSLEPTLGLPWSADRDDRYDRYASYGSLRSGTYLDRATGLLAGQWETRPTAGSVVDVSWGHPADWGNRTVEEHEVRELCAGGRGWVWLHAFRNPTLGHRYPIETTRAVFSHAGGEWDITASDCGTGGHPYALADVFFEVPYRLAIWGRIYSDDHTEYRTFFWEARYSSGEPMSDPCWSGAGPAQRLAIRQEEAWWDSVQGWVFGSGSMGMDGQPTGAGVVHGRSHVIGREAGFAWTVDQVSPAWGACLSATATPAP